MISPAVLAGFTGCASSAETIGSPPIHIAIPAETPPSPATWPKYPHFAARSCWARPFLGGDAKIEEVAPSYAPAARAHPIAPAVVAHRILARLGDRRYVRAIRFTPAPAAVGSRVHVLYAGGHPPGGALQARVVVRGAKYVHHPSPEQTLRTGIAEYEGEIVGDALRDDLCDAGGPPLVMWSSDLNGGGFAERGQALDQRFPNPSSAAFRKRVARIGRGFGFTVVSLRLLRPRQIAPLLIVRTNRSRKAFVADIPKIEELLNPRTYSRSLQQSADTFEAFFFAAEDAKGPFVFTQGASRSESEGGEWAANGCLYPYPTLGPTDLNGTSCS
jgi:hypothetical protein